MIRVDTRPRRRNSMKADVERRFASHLQWIRGRSCVVESSGGCEGRMEAAHVDHAGGKGVGIKVSDTKTVPLCQHHHAELHRGAKSFEAKHQINLVDAAYAYAEKSPHRVLWADIPGLRR